MDAAKRATWVRALRSGKYTQTQSLLRNNRDGMCCLGVGIDVFCPQHWQRDGGVWSDKGREDLPSADTRNVLGLTGSEVSTLAELNDDALLSFNEIANHIERHGSQLDAEFDERDRERNGRSNRTD